MADVALDAVGAGVSLTGTAALIAQSNMAASGSISLDGFAWLSPRAHGQDTLVASGSIRIGGLGAFGVTRKPIRLRTGETYTATDADGWTAPDVTPPAIREDA